MKITSCVNRTPNGCIITMPEELKLLPCPACGDQPVAYGVEDPRCVGFSCKCGLTSPQSYETKGHPHSWNAAASAWNSLPRALVWTTEPPKEAGHYWCRYTGSDKSTWSPAYIPAVDDLHSYSMDKHDQIEWAGPIALPKELQNV